MTEQTDLSVGRADVLDLSPRLGGRGRLPGSGIDRATRIVRLLAWIAMFAVCCLMLWTLGGMAAHAEDPKAAARAIGQAGTAAAGAIARDASKPGTVPGYAGTDLPERNITASGMEDAARARLADPDDPGGKAGRAVIEGTVSRPDAPVSQSDPAIVRGEAIAGNSQNPAHGADGLASGSVSDCGSGLGDAGDGGPCGGVRYCVGAGCETVRSGANTGFVDATSRLNMAIELGGEKFDREDMRFFRARAGPAPSACSGSPTAARTTACSKGSPDAAPRSASWRANAMTATPTISASAARRRPSSASASGANGSGARSAPSSGASCRSRAASSSAAAGATAAASRWPRSRASTSAASTSPSSPRT